MVRPLREQQLPPTKQRRRPRPRARGPGLRHPGDRLLGLRAKTATPRKAAEPLEQRWMAQTKKKTKKKKEEVEEEGPRQLLHGR